MQGRPKKEEGGCRCWDRCKYISLCCYTSPTLYLIFYYTTYFATQFAFMIFKNQTVCIYNEWNMFILLARPHLTVFGSLARRLADSRCNHCWHHCKRVVGPANVPSLSVSLCSKFSRRTADATTLSLGGRPDLRPLALRLVLPLWRAQNRK